MILELLDPLNDYSPIISVLVTIILVVVTIVYAWFTRGMLKQSKTDTQIAYSRSRLEMYYYPLLSFFDMCQKTESNSETTSVSFNIDNNTIFNIIHKYQYLATAELRIEVDILVTLLNQRIQEKGKFNASTGKLDNRPVGGQIPISMVTDMFTKHSTAPNYFITPPTSINDLTFSMKPIADEFKFGGEGGSIADILPSVSFDSFNFPPIFPQDNDRKLVRITSEKDIKQFTKTEMLVRSDIQSLIDNLDRLNSKTSFMKALFNHIWSVLTVTTVLIHLSITSFNTGMTLL
jgi:hypothetical protein